MFFLRCSLSGLFTSLGIMKVPHCNEKGPVAVLPWHQAPTLLGMPGQAVPGRDSPWGRCRSLKPRGQSCTKISVARFGECLVLSKGNGPALEHSACCENTHTRLGGPAPTGSRSDLGTSSTGHPSEADFGRSRWKFPFPHQLAEVGADTGCHVHVL